MAYAGIDATHYTAVDTGIVRLRTFTSRELIVAGDRLRRHHGESVREQHVMWSFSYRLEHLPGACYASGTRLVLCQLSYTANHRRQRRFKN
jgi:hypothetical protein